MSRRAVASLRNETQNRRLSSLTGTLATEARSQHQPPTVSERCYGKPIHYPPSIPFGRAVPADGSIPSISRRTACSKTCSASSISVDDDVLTIRAEKRVEQENGTGTRQGTGVRHVSAIAATAAIPRSRAGARAFQPWCADRDPVAHRAGKNGQRRIAIDSSPPPASTTETESESRH